MLQDPKPRNRAGEVSFSSGPDLDDGIQDSKLMPQKDSSFRSWGKGMSLFCMWGYLNCCDQRADYADCIYLQAIISPILFNHLMTSHYSEPPLIER